MNDPSAWVSKDKRYDYEKHKSERAELGFSTYDWWNFCDYIAWVNIQALENFKLGVGYPGDLKCMEEWVTELDIMIDGFKAHLTVSNLEYDFHDKEAGKALEETKNKGFELYSKRFASLWD